MKLAVLLVSVLYTQFQFGSPGAQPEPDSDVWTATLKPIRNRRIYGESCNKTLRCDKKAWLNCIEDRCDCIQPDEMIYVPEKAKCVSKSGERCKFQINEGAEDDPLTIYEKTDCVENAECVPDGTCSCLANFYEAFDGTCSPKAKYNETCASDDYCEDTSSCINGVCVCDTTQLLDITQGTCVGKAGHLLKKSKICINSASPNSQGVCICKPGSERYAGKDGICYNKKTHGEQCTNNTECKSRNAFLLCINGLCACDSAISKFRSFFQGLYNVYAADDDDDDFRISITGTRDDYNLYQCVGLAGKECNDAGNCVENAECNRNGYPPRMCNCKNGYSKTSEGTCGLGYGKACPRFSECSDKLVCSNMRCRCPQQMHQEYNESSQQCLSKVHGTCSNDADCITNAVCSSKPNSRRKSCACKDGFVETKSRYCAELAFGSSCYRYNRNCDSIAGLKCINGYCACPDSFTYFNTTVRKCLGLVGARCEPQHDDRRPFYPPEFLPPPPVFNDHDNDAPTIRACVANAECKILVPELGGTCECLNGFIENEEFFCVPVAHSYAVNNSALIES